MAQFFNSDWTYIISGYNVLDHSLVELKGSLNNDDGGGYEHVALKFVRF